MSQREFALMVGMNKTYIGDIELGKRNPSLKSLERIAGGFGLSVGKLIGDIESD
ncbi:helix-turn-helix protein [Coriobacteriaceae bacterium CHKCI002]|nr:helix-turn-helix protein [Coriobacteriaceae bacterium CHKCI002]